ncbi:hypothetical protein ABMA32_04555 [Mesorhizobium sp. VNQ89]|uniref:hypothetical protein n=1 Tax=Mesorhizobium quangtriensis TaxID=3157709 RepID=UPI0032B6F9E8
MKRIEQKRRGTVIAFVATLLLFMQALAGAYATGAAAASPMLDAFGNPLCMPGMEQSGGDADGSGHKTLPDCCTVSCSMFLSTVSDDRPTHSLSNPLSTSVARTCSVLDAHSPAFALERRSGRPRAPPQLI